MALQTGINLCSVFKDGLDPVAQIAEYQILDSDFDSGTVFGDGFSGDLVLTRDEFADLLKGSKAYLSSISSVHSTRLVDIPDVPLDLTMLDTAPGVNYSITVGDLIQTITWDSGSEELTIHSSSAFSISYTAYTYFIDSLHDLVYAIDHL